MKWAPALNTYAPNAKSGRIKEMKMKDVSRGWMSSGEKKKRRSDTELALVSDNWQ
jgi:hypothetical protein